MSKLWKRHIDPNRFRNRAEQLRMFADEMKDDGVKRQLYDLAAKYDEIAKRATARPKQH